MERPLCEVVGSEESVKSDFGIYLYPQDVDYL